MIPKKPIMRYDEDGGPRGYSQWWEFYEALSNYHESICDRAVPALLRIATYSTDPVAKADAKTIIEEINKSGYNRK